MSNAMTTRELNSIPNPFDFRGRTAAVTGASRGIGEAIATGFIRGGANVIALQRKPVQAELLALAEENGVSVTHIPVDLGDEDSVSAAIEASLALGAVDILVNNAGTQIRHDTVDFPLTDFDEVWAINGRAVFQLCQGFARPMLERGDGKIVNVASLLSFQGGLRVPAYAAAKGAVAQFTKSMCNEWAARGVNVNAIAPGYVSTDMNEALLGDAERSEQISVRIPAGRWANGEDIAGAVHFLSSSAADYIHGVVLPVDGGWLAR